MGVGCGVHHPGTIRRLDEVQVRKGATRSCVIRCSYSWEDTLFGSGLKQRCFRGTLGVGTDLVSSVARQMLCGEGPP
jgi:hypothetical protein